MDSLAGGLVALGSIYIGILFLYVIFIILFGVVISLIFRPYVLWYFKINKRIRLQEETNSLLKEIATKKETTSLIKPESDHSAYMPKYR